MPAQKSHGLAFDRASVRAVDADGRLHVAVSNISKAAVNPYLGAEIPDWRNLGLSAKRRYFLLRDPKELERAVATFNNIPLLSRHIPVSATEPHKQFVVGATGTDATYDAPYLKNSLVVWDSVAIALIDSEEQKELSCAYRYRADMTPGVFEGTHYDGVMRDIRGNHVALVEAGRAGPDVVVGDSNPFINYLSESPNMKPGQRTTIAQDGVIDVSITPEEPAASVGADDTPEAPATPEVPVSPANDSVLPDGLHAILASKLGEEEASRIMQKLQDPSPAAPAANDDDAPEPVTQQAMDAALSKAKREGENSAIARMTAIRIAERECRPILGDIVAQDSAESVYKMALDARGITTQGVPSGAFRHMVKLALSQTHPVKTAIAMDAKARDGFHDRYPHAKNLKVI